MKDKVDIILASASPRRRELLAEAGYEFRVVESGIDEAEFLGEDMTSRDYAEVLARAKALDVAKRFPDSLVIGADTVVDFDGRIIGKAEDAKEAEEITRTLFSAPHKVITGIAIIRIADDVDIVTSDTTRVFPARLTEEQIANHIKGDGWQGRAGAYGIKEQGDEFVERIEGSLTNVMGFPMELLECLLEKFVEK